MWGLTVIKAAATFCYVYFIYVLAFGFLVFMSYYTSNASRRRYGLRLDPR